MSVQVPVKVKYNRKSDSDSWVRPSDWPIIIDAVNEVQFLVADTDVAHFNIETTFSRSSGSQNLIIDWGDGTSNTISNTAPVTTFHQYSIGTGTPCSRGYTTFKVRVYFTGSGISTLVSTKIYGPSTQQRFNTVGVLEAYYGDNTQKADMTNYFASLNLNTLGNYIYLEYVKLPSIINFAFLSQTFNYCISLAKIEMPTSAPNLTSLNSTFQGCNSLRSVALPSNSNITALNNTFQDCHKLNKVTIPSTPNLTTISRAFGNCYSLKNLTLPDLTKVTDMSYMASNCYGLELIKISKMPSFTSLTTVNAAYAFENCSNLINLSLPRTVSANAVYNAGYMFQICTRLKSFIFPINFNASTLAYCFYNTNIQTVIFQSNCPSLTTIAYAFSNCLFLNKVIFPLQVSSSISLEQAFNNCNNLKSITIPSTYQITNLASTFNLCRQLKEVNWNPGNQNLLTTLSSTFNLCTSLKSITLPTSMNALTTAQSVASGCYELNTPLVFPASLPLITTFSGVANSSNNLKDITLPINTPLCTNASSIANFTKVNTLTIPNIIRPTTTSLDYQNMPNLETLVLPGSQQYTSITTLSISNCPYLKVLTNLTYIGPLTGSTNINITIAACSITDLSFSQRLASLRLEGTNLVRNKLLTSVRLLNTGTGQWTGVSPHINVSYTSISTANLIQLFNDMAAQGNITSKTINITGATGSSGLTASDRLIVTSKGWTITG